MRFVYLVDTDIQTKPVDDSARTEHNSEIIKEEASVCNQIQRESGAKNIYFQ